LKDGSTLQLAILQPLKNHNFSLLARGQFVSMLGDQVYVVALVYQVQTLSLSAAALGSVLLCYSLSQLLFLLLGGVIVDRLPRRSILLASDVGRGLLVLVVAYLGQQNTLEIWHLAVLSTFNGTVSAFFMPARQAVQPQLIPKEQLGQANALMELAFQVSILVGPLLGAILIQIIAPKGAFAFDSITFVVSALCIVFITVPTAKPTTGPNKPRIKLFSEIREGFEYVRTSTWLWVTIAIFGFLGLVSTGPMQLLVAILVRQQFVDDVNIYGLFLSTRAVAALFSIVIVGQFKHLRRRGLLAYLGVILGALGILFLGIGGSNGILIACIVAISAYGSGYGCFGVIWHTVLQEIVPAEYLGRVVSVDMLGSYCMIPFGLVLAGWLADSYGAASLMIISGILSAGAALGGLLVREVRTLA
jgi:MFS family permease